MKNVKVHDGAREDIRSFPKAVKKDIGELLFKLQLGVLLGMPESRPMPSLHPGAHELRIRDSAGISRVFYYLKCEAGILVFHAFTKKTQKTRLSDVVHEGKSKSSHCT